MKTMTRLVLSTTLAAGLALPAMAQGTASNTVHPAAPQHAAARHAAIQQAGVSKAAPRAATVAAGKNESPSTAKAPPLPAQAATRNESGAGGTTAAHTKAN